MRLDNKRPNYVRKSAVAVSLPFMVCGINVQGSAFKAVVKNLAAVLNRLKKFSLLLIIHRIRNIIFQRLLKKVGN